MRAWLAMAVIAMPVAWPPAAQACLALSLPDAVLFDRPPARPPPGYSVIKVVGSLSEQDPIRLRVIVLEPERRRRIGARAWLDAEGFTSCTDWGRLGSAAFAVVRPAGRVQGRTLLQARIYRRSWWDHFWYRFGLTRYTAD